MGITIITTRQPPPRHLIIMGITIMTTQVLQWPPQQYPQLQHHRSIIMGITAIITTRHLITITTRHLITMGIMMAFPRVPR